MRQDTEPRDGPFASAAIRKRVATRRFHDPDTVDGRRHDRRLRARRDGRHHSHADHAADVYSDPEATLAKKVDGMAKLRRDSGLDRPVVCTGYGTCAAARHRVQCEGARSGEHQQQEPKQ